MPRNFRLKERENLTEKIRPGKLLMGRPLKPVAGLDANSLLEMTEASYIDLVQWTGKQARSDKRGKLRREEQSTPPAAIWNLSDAPQQHRQCRSGGLRLQLSQEAAAECRNAWLRQVQGTESHYYRVIGSAEALMAKAAELGQIWI